MSQDTVLEISGSLWFWLRWGATGIWLGAFALALALTVAALWRPRDARFHGIARGVWVAAMVGFIGMWSVGALMEMMRRVWELSLEPLLLSMAVFSFLMAGVASLVREWFTRRDSATDAQWNFNARRMAWTLNVLCVIAVALGGLTLWPFANGDYLHFETSPQNWWFALSGAQMAGAAQLVRARAAWPLRVINPRPATWWLAAFALILLWLQPLVASVVLCAFAAFLLRVWGMRRETARVPLWLRRVARAIPLLFLVGVLAWHNETATSWMARQHANAAPLWWIAGAAFGVWIVLLLTGGRFALRLAVYENGWARALLLGTSVGAGAALLLFGVAGALFWSFWPLAALFFDLLKWHESENLVASGPDADAPATPPISVVD